MLVTAIAQTVVPALPALGFGREVGQRSAEDPSPLVPPGGFFSIWGVIFAGALAFAIYQLRSAQRTDPLIQRVRPWAATAFFLNAVWIVVAQSTGIEIATLLILLGIWSAALAALFGIVPEQRRLSALRQAVVLVPFSLLAGWTTAATFLSVAGLLDNVFGTPGPEFVAIAGATLTGITLIVKTRANLWFTLTLAYAFTGIVLRTVFERRPELTTAAAVGLGVVVLVYIAARLRVSRSRMEGGTSFRSPSDKL